MYAYNSDGDIIGEINANNGYYLQWTVDVANTKGAATMIRFDPSSPACFSGF